MSVRKKVYGSLAILALLGTGLYLYKTRPTLFSSIAQAKSASAKPEDKEKGKDATPVELAMAARSPISAWVSSTANVRALRDVAVATQIEGIVSKVQAEEGDFASEGQTLATIDDTQFRIKLKLAEEKLAQARIQIEKARIRREKTVAQIGHTKIEFERYQKAQNEGLVSEKEAAAYKYKLDELMHDEKVAASEIVELQHRVEELQAEIAQCKLDISRAQIRAPYAGYVTQRMVNLGQRVRAMDALFNIGTFSPLYADVFLSERDTQAVKPGQTATIRLGSDDNLTIQGTVERISPIVDQSTGTVKVTIAFRPTPGFRPGAFVRVAIRTDTRNDAILIPRRALIEEDGQSFVYVANADSARRKKVELGYQSEGMVEIRNGLAPGEKVVVAGQGALKEGGKIRVTHS
jgi:membrane fusion protein (multidrug efflux system)